MYSYVIYICAVMIATFFATMAQRYSVINNNGKSVPNRILWMFSLLSLVIVMGFRDYTVGVDGANYILGYNLANSVSFAEYYSTYTTEPGFYLIYKVVYLIFNDYQWLFIISAIITLSFFYKALSYENNNLSLGLIVFIFATTQYFYYFGIMRMGIAVSIIAVGYRYLIENKRKKYILMVLLATTFHYSAFFALIGLFMKENTIANRFKKNTILKLLVLIPVSFLGVKFLIYPFVTVDRYQNYINSSELISWGFLNSSLPFLILFSFYYNKMTIENKNYQFYYFLFIVKLLTEVFAPIIGIGRMVWYVNISICFLLAAIFKIEKNIILKMILLLLTIIYCIVYSYSAYFGESWRGEHMIPYKFFWENRL